MSPNWERLWRSAGIQFVVFFIIAFIIYGDQPKVGASQAKLVSFYDGDRTRILIASVIFGFGILNLLWFGAALNSALRDAGQGGWGAAATAASTALGTFLLLLTMIGAALAHSIAGSGNDSLTAGLNDFSWVLTVLASFPAAMLVMASAFGLWRAGIISSALFTVGVAAVVLVLLGSTTWAHDGFWAPDGAYNRWITTIVGLAWLVVVSGLLTMRSPAKAPERAAAATQ
jgi:hypothetical protein